MSVATSKLPLEVGVRELKNNLSRYLEKVSKGDDVIVTDRGQPIARLSAIDSATSKLTALVAAGVVVAPKAKDRRRPTRRIMASGSVSELVADQRR